MFTFYAQLTAPQSVAGSLMTTLASLTRLSRIQIQVFSAEEDWSSWGR